MCLNWSGRPTIVVIRCNSGPSLRPASARNVLTSKDGTRRIDILRLCMSTGRSSAPYTPRWRQTRSKSISSSSTCIVGKCHTSERNVRCLRKRICARSRASVCHLCSSLLISACRCGTSRLSKDTDSGMLKIYRETKTRGFAESTAYLPQEYSP